MTIKRKYNKHLKPFARELRKNSTTGEIRLWCELLRGRKMYGYQFLRQFPINNYIVDFICRKLKLIIEVDGYSHNFKYDEDIKRDKNLSEVGYKVLRITEREVKYDIHNVQRAIELSIEGIRNITSPCTPFKEGGLKNSPLEKGDSPDAIGTGGWKNNNN